MTDRFGQAIGDVLQRSFVVGLSGTLGSGKTRLVQAIASGLGIDSTNVASPTFTICIPHTGRLDILHLDAYRINHQEEIDELGLDEEVEDGAVLLVEWSERIQKSLPQIDLQIHAKPIGSESREYTVIGNTEKGRAAVGQLEELLTKQGRG